MPTNHDFPKALIAHGAIFFNGIKAEVSSASIEGDEFADEAETFKSLTTICSGSLTAFVNMDPIDLLKLAGHWEWIKTYCPNKRLVYLMDHSKKRRIRLKNYKRALREIPRLSNGGTK